MREMMRALRSIPVLVLALFLTVAVFSDGILHAAIPHHTHDESEIVWSSLHATLHQEKRVGADSGTAAFLLCAIFLAALYVLRGAGRNVRPLSLEILLRRGVLPHRRFG